MAKCKVCGKEMTKKVGCSISTLFCEGKEYPRIKVGAPDDFRLIRKNRYCPDCEAPYGSYHHWGCDGEACPVCHRQLLICDCKDVYVKY